MSISQHETTHSCLTHVLNDSKIDILIIPQKTSQEEVHFGDKNVK